MLKSHFWPKFRGSSSSGKLMLLVPMLIFCLQSQRLYINELIFVFHNSLHSKSENCNFTTTFCYNSYKNCNKKLSKSLSGIRSLLTTNTKIFISNIFMIRKLTTIRVYTKRNQDECYSIDNVTPASNSYFEIQKVLLKNLKKSYN